MGKGFVSPEEHMQEYTELFLLLQQKKEQGSALFLDKSGQLEEREQETEVFLPAVYLRECFALTRQEYWILMFLFCCGMEERLCMDYRNKYLQGQPVLQYILQLFSTVFSVDFLFTAQLYRRDGVWKELLEPPREEAGEGGPGGFLRQPLSITPMVFFFLLTGGLAAEEWYTVYLAEEELPEAPLPLHEREYERLCRYLEAEEPLRIFLYGSRGSGCHTLLRRAGRELCKNILLVTPGELLSATAEGCLCIRQSLRLMVRLLRPVILLEPVTEPPEPSSPAMAQWERLLAQLLADAGDSPLCFLAQTREQAELVRDRADAGIFLAGTLSGEEKRLALDAWFAPEERSQWQEALFQNGRFNIGGLRRQRRRIALQAWAEGCSPGERAAWPDRLWEEQENPGFGRLIEEGYEPEAMVLPEDCRRQLETVLRLARVWKGPKGLQLLFHGDSGTGKTMAASVLARQLQLPLFKVDLSRVMDKYIGETEKHMDEIFRMARQEHYILFFDEADALFAKRTAIRDSHDRYANVSAAYLLQRMEDYDGILILATNLRDNFDDAFVRRIRFVVKFRNPDREGRERLWKKLLEGEPPVAQEVDFGALAAAAELSPARICAAAQVAKLLAFCGESPLITKEYLLEALEMEAGKDETTIKGF